jgi:hypothetical protein
MGDEPTRDSRDTNSGSNPSPSGVLPSTPAESDKNQNGDLSTMHNDASQLYVGKENEGSNQEETELQGHEFFFARIKPPWFLPKVPPNNSETPPLGNDPGVAKPSQDMGDHVCGSAPRGEAMV